MMGAGRCLHQEREWEILVRRREVMRPFQKPGLMAKSLLLAIVVLSMVLFSNKAFGQLGLFFMDVRYYCKDLPHHHFYRNMIWAPRYVRLVLIANRLQPGGNVLLKSTNPSLFPVPEKTSIKGRKRFTSMEVKVKEPSFPVPVQILAHMLPGRLDQKMWTGTLYPRLRIRSFKLLPKRTKYRHGDEVTAKVKLNYKIPELPSDYELAVKVRGPVPDPPGATAS